MGEPVARTTDYRRHAGVGASAGRTAASGRLTRRAARMSGSGTLQTAAVCPYKIRGQCPSALVLLHPDLRALYEKMVRRLAAALNEPDTPGRDGGKAILIGGNEPPAETGAQTIRDHIDQAVELFVAASTDAPWRNHCSSAIGSRQSRQRLPPLGTALILLAASSAGFAARAWCAR